MSFNALTESHEAPYQINIQGNLQHFEKELKLTKHS